MYGILVTSAILICTLIVEREVKNSGKNPEILWGLVFWGVLAGVIGARIYHVIDYWELYGQNLSLIPMIWNGGLGIIGAIILGGSAIFLYLRLKKEPVLWWFDKGFSVLPLGQAIGRLGNIWNKELLPRAYYEIVLDLVLFGVLYFLGKRTSNPGLATIVYIVSYSLIRIALN